MSYNQKPITAQIKHSTKGGMKTTQPLLNMGAPVQMNMPGSQDSPGKNTKPNNGKKLPKNPYPGNITSGLENVKSYKIPSFLGMENTPDKDRATVKRFGANERISGDAKKRLNILNSAKSTTETKTNKYKSGQGVLSNDSSKVVPDFSGGINDYAKNTGNTKPEKYKPGQGVLSNDSKKSTKITGAIGSDLRKKQYDDKGWAYDDTIKKDKKVAKKVAKKETIKTTPKVAVKNKVTNTVKTAKAIKKNTAGTRKSAKANKKQKQADAAMASGNTRKANRKQKAADRKTAKAKKKFSQAAGAVNPK